MRERLLTVGEATRLLGVSCDTLRRLERRGVVAARRDHRRWRWFALEDLQRLARMREPGYEAEPVGGKENMR